VRYHGGHQSPQGLNGDQWQEYLNALSIRVDEAPALTSGTVESAIRGERDLAGRDSLASARADAIAAARDDAERAERERRGQEAELARELERWEQRIDVEREQRAQEARRVAEAQRVAEAEARAREAQRAREAAERERQAEARRRAESEARAREEERRRAEVAHLPVVGCYRYARDTIYYTVPVPFETVVEGVMGSDHFAFNVIGRENEDTFLQYLRAEYGIRSTFEMRCYVSPPGTNPVTVLRSMQSRWHRSVDWRHIETSWRPGS
jgi:hypothetical protein